jgi:hypothetical protein
MQQIDTNNNDGGKGPNAPTPEKATPVVVAEDSFFWKVAVAVIIVVVLIAVFK